MRLGVTAKIFIAYAALVAALAASSIFTVRSLHRGRQEMAANQERLKVQAEIELATRNLETFPQAQGRSATTSRLAAGGGIPFARARAHLEEARAAIEELLRRDPPPYHRFEFEEYRRDVAGLEASLREVLEAGAAEATPEEELTYVIAAFNKVATKLRKRNAGAAEELMRDEQRAVEAALMLGGLGLVVALGAALLMFRTLRPLKVLRVHARQIAGGDYGRRIQVASRDEIGELAREFDAMGRAIEEREQRLIRSERLATVGRMAAQITHEIRNPLASIGLYVELLGDELRADEAEARRLVESIGKEVDRLSEITETYLRFVRLPRPKLEREDLGAIATSVMEFARAELSLAGIALELAVAAGLPEVAADENQIRQALLNLVRNAKEAMPGGGTLRVEVSAGPGQVRLAISDTGPGIAPEHLGKIFDPFFSTKDKGTGLGLALVQQIVGEHGGRVEVHSPAAGGTTFVLSLPALPPRARLTDTERAPAQPAEAEPPKVH